MPKGHRNLTHEACQLVMQDHRSQALPYNLQVFVFLALQSTLLSSQWCKTSSQGDPAEQWTLSGMADFQSATDGHDTVLRRMRLWTCMLLCETDICAAFQDNHTQKRATPSLSQETLRTLMLMKRRTGIRFLPSRELH